jgi:hypothetical protein
MSDVSDNKPMVSGAERLSISPSYPARWRAKKKALGFLPREVWIWPALSEKLHAWVKKENAKYEKEQKKEA